MVLNEHIQYRYTASSKERYIAVGIYVGSRFLSAPKIGKVTMLRYDYDISTYILIPVTAYQYLYSLNYRNRKEKGRK